VPETADGRPAFAEDVKKLVNTERAKQGCAP
jgi:hypothetical protein